MNFRCVYLDHMLDKLNRKPSHKTDKSSSTVFEQYKVLMRLQQVDAATLQDNFSVALYLLRSTQKVAIFKRPAIYCFGIVHFFLVQHCSGQDSR